MRNAPRAGVPPTRRQEVHITVTEKHSDMHRGLVPLTVLLGNTRSDVGKRLLFA